MTAIKSTRRLDGTPEESARAFDGYDSLAADMSIEIISQACKGDLAARAHVMHSQRFANILDRFDIDPQVARQAIMKRWQTHDATRRDYQAKRARNERIIAIPDVDPHGRMTAHAIAREIGRPVTQIYSLIYQKKIKCFKSKELTPAGAHVTLRLKLSDVQDALGKLQHYTRRAKK